jgi:heme-degrading monooxygenase HmoA
MSAHVLTVTSAVVPPASADSVVEAYRHATSTLPHMVLDTALVRGEGDEWRIVTLWRSREQWNEYRQQVGTSAAVKIFRDAGAEPTVTAYEVVHRAATG